MIVISLGIFFFLYSRSGNNERIDEAPVLLMVMTAALADILTWYFVAEVALALIHASESVGLDFVTAMLGV